MSCFEISHAPRDDGNIAALLEDFARRFGDQPALYDLQTRYSYAALANAADTAGARLAQRVAPGERVALLAPATPDWVVHFFAILHAGAVAVLLDPARPDAELERILQGSGVRFLLVSPGQQPRAQALAERGACSAWCSYDALHGSTDRTHPRAPHQRALDQPAVVTFAAGPSGDRRGVLTSHGSLRFQLQAFQHVVPGRMRRTLSILEPYEPFGLTIGLLVGLAHGARIKFCGSRHREDIARAMYWTQPTHLMVTPAHLECMRRDILRRTVGDGLLDGWWFQARLSLAWNLPTAWRRLLFRAVHRDLGQALGCVVCSGGAPLTRETEKFFWNLGIRVLQGYGTTEASPVVSFNRLHARRFGSVGRPLPGVEVRVRANGAIETRGPHVMLGYDGDDGRAADGWWRTGDTGRIDADGYLFVEPPNAGRAMLGDADG